MEFNNKKNKFQDQVDIQKLNKLILKGLKVKLVVHLDKKKKITNYYIKKIFPHQIYIILDVLKQKQKLGIYINNRIQSGPRSHI